jgi:hypothetical protein
LLAPGDFNRDGNPDLIQVNSENDVANFITFVGAGDGTFRPARRYGLPMLPNVTAVAHLNRDDFPDIIFAGRGQTLVSVGNGDAAFTNISGPATFSYWQGAAPGVGTLNDPGIIVTDLNGDANPDAVIGNRHGASVFRGNRDGTFREPPSVQLRRGTSGAARGDFNGDGLEDFAVVNSEAGDVSVLASKPGGGLVVAGSTTVPAASWFHAIYPGDFNGDRKVDLLCIPWSLSPPLGAMMILLGKGDGTFSLLPSFYSQSNFFAAAAPALGDFNRDGKLDIIHWVTWDELGFFGGNGDGTFRSLLRIPTM